MLSSSRFFRISLLVFAAGVLASLWRPSSKFSTLKSAEEYWAETGLGSAPLEDLLQDRTCASSEKYFLSCANALLNMANRFNLGLDKAGRLVSFRASLAKDMTSEKTQLQPWKELYHNEPQEAVKVSFLMAWRALDAQFIPREQKAFLISVGLNGFISVFRDPHTYFMPVSQFREVISKADSRSTSLGITLGVSDRGEYVVRKVTEGSPASSSGIRKGDILAAIDGIGLKDVAQARISEMLKGDVGGRTAVTLRRDGRRLKFNLVRKEVTVATVSTRVIDGMKPIAVIGINKFAKGSCPKVKEALEIVKKTQVRGLLLDLRDNPGGQMEEAACIVSLFVGPEKRIFEIRYLDTSKKAEAYYGTEEKVFNLPVAVLVNASSASAAEIVAGALRDFNRAVLVGEKTFGKGSFQEGEYWVHNKNIALFETKGFYYLPSGRSPQMKGLEPDVVVEFDRIKVVRESDQFINPLKAPERQIRPVGSVLSGSECLEIEEHSTSEDIQLKKAQQILFCTNTARASL